jgi:uncharacterized repeat protein (TIGR03803 family)
MRWKKACALLSFFALTAIVALAQTFTSLVSFDVANGKYPNGPLVQATNGDLYGTTSYGGAGSSCKYGCGTIFKITPNGALTTVHSFNLSDGADPLVLVQASDGYLYGLTRYGGESNCLFPCGYGTFFKITPAGVLTTVSTFNANSFGQFGPSSLMQAANGNFYGTTYSSSVGILDGTIFEMTPAGVVTILYEFYGTNTGDADGGLVQGRDGNLYGTTSAGGVIADGCAAGCGTIFKITPAGVFSILHSFDFTDGFLPNGLVQATAGDLYGTTQNGGNNYGDIGEGTIFKITLAGALTTLHIFNGPDGDEPEAGLVQATDGNFYGTTFGGGTNGGYGTIFEITPSGVLTTLHSFGASGGVEPQAELVQATNGDLYGTTRFGGGDDTSCPDTEGGAGCGTVFSLSVGLGPFVKTLPGVGQVGSIVQILGTDLTGATSVTFNETPAAFIVVRPSEILTRVPAGATTGKVNVITPSGTLVSNVGFVVP